MPPIHSYYCNNCDFKISKGVGVYLYALAENGEEVVCPHPGEIGILSRVLGVSRDEALSWLNRDYAKLASETITKFEQRVGQKHQYVCLDCFTESFIDKDREKLICKECESDHLKLANELVNKSCPKCNQGTIMAAVHGIS